MTASGVVETGLERLLAEGLPGFAGARAGLITNHSGVDRDLRSGVDRLAATDRLDLVALFAPEHGVRGEAQAGVAVETAIDRRTGLPIRSLYGETRQPSAEMLTGLDLLLFDIQDVGVRYATYLSTMVYAQAAAASVDLPFAVLDRPNPLGGRRVEGNLLDPAFASFVGVHPLPIVHGMTAGEIARLVAAERGFPEPIVVAMRGWLRDWWYDETGLPWVQPSPNLPTLDSVTVYPGSCLIEGTNLSEGRGTTRPFEYIGAPWLEPIAVAEAMRERDIEGVAFRAATFTPVFSKHAGILCGGIQIHLLDRGRLRPVELGLHLLDALRRLDPSSFAWVTASDGGSFVDLLLGTDLPRRQLDAGVPVAEVMADWPDQADAFAVSRQRFLLYD